ncbi:MAG: hypothetical protein QNJ82_16530 [Gammaproteobacteria bacterium]|nr:hypothetical protein [Gammaproteobacteria bacterium]
MAKSFRVPLNEEPAALVERARKLAEGAGAEFSGDASSGCFSAKGVEGEYAVEGNSITVTVTRKPLAAPWSLVESKVKAFFS